VAAYFRGASVVGFCLLGVLSAVEFNHQFSGWACKVHDMSADGMLMPEAERRAGR
jgi:hypothetical protein